METKIKRMRKIVVVSLLFLFFNRVEAQNANFINVKDYSIKLNNQEDTSKQVINIIDYEIKSSQIDSVVVLLKRQEGSIYYKKFSSKLNFVTGRNNGNIDSTFSSYDSSLVVYITTSRTSNGNLIYKLGRIDVNVQSKEIAQHDVKCISFYFVSKGIKSPVYTKCLLSLDYKNLKDYTKAPYFIFDQVNKTLTFNISISSIYNIVALYSLEGQKLFEGSANDFHFDCTMMLGRVLIATCLSNSGEMHKCKLYVS